MLDFFAGSGITACPELSRRFNLVDSNLQAIDVMRRRFAHATAIAWSGTLGKTRQG